MHYVSFDPWLLGDASSPHRVEAGHQYAQSLSERTATEFSQVFWFLPPAHENPPRRYFRGLPSLRLIGTACRLVVSLA